MNKIKKKGQNRKENCNKRKKGLDKKFKDQNQRTKDCNKKSLKNCKNQIKRINYPKCNKVNLSKRIKKNKELLNWKN